MQLSGLVVAALSAARLVGAVPVEDKRGYCENTPTSRHCWGNFNIDSGVTYTWPNTGVTRFVTQTCPVTNQSSTNMSSTILTSRMQFLPLMVLTSS